MKTWDWKRFKGSATALRYARRDLSTLKRAVSLAVGRSVCVQAGGNLGVFPKWLAAHFDLVHTFEPSVTVFPLLCHNAPERNIRRHLAALGSEAGSVGTSQTRRGTKVGRYAHEGITHVVDGNTAPRVRLDDLNLPACSLIVLDLEGYEGFALRGAARTIQEHRPVLMVEVNGNCRHYGWSSDEVRALITGQGYRMVFRDHADEVFVPEERA